MYKFLKDSPKASAAESPESNSHIKGSSLTVGIILRCWTLGLENTDRMLFMELGNKQTMLSQ